MLKSAGCNLKKLALEKLITRFKQKLRGSAKLLPKIVIDRVAYGVVK